MNPNLKPVFKVAELDKGQGASERRGRHVYSIPEDSSTEVTKPIAASVDCENRFLNLFISPKTYISGMTALSIPDEGRWGGDWHFMEALCHPQSRIHSSGEKGTMSNTNKLFGDWLITDKSSILRERGISCHDLVFCASHTRAIADLIFHSVSRNIYPAHVIAEGIIEEKIEWEEINKMLDLMIPNLEEKQIAYITQWRNKILEPAKNGILY